jgi:hypothetical protein
MYSYDQCIQLYRKFHQFIGFLDIDEFVVIADRSANDFPTILKRYGNYGGLTLNWKYLGSSGHISRPKGYLIHNYWKCVSSPLVKSFVNTDYIAGVSGTPHHFHYRLGKHAVDTSYNVVLGPNNPDVHHLPNETLYNISFIHHYVTKSWTDFQHKHRRGAGDGARRNVHYFELIQKKTKQNCTSLLNYHRLESPLNESFSSF